MPLQSTLERWLPSSVWQSTATIDQEIRDELEFHLAMRTEENLQAGMTPDEARRDAEQRFGDYEANRRACQTIALGPRRYLPWVQLGLVVALLVAVVYMGVQLVQLQARSDSQIEALHRTIEQLQAASPPQPASTNQQMAYQQWGIPAKPWQSDSLQGEASLEGWGSQSPPLDEPWSDWSCLDE